jgi:hypothetical protein
MGRSAATSGRAETDRKLHLRVLSGKTDLFVEATAFRISHLEDLIRREYEEEVFSEPIQLFVRSMAARMRGVRRA